MARIDNIKKLNATEDEINKAFNKALNKKNLAKIGNELLKDIIRRTRLGFGVINNNELRYKLPPLSPKYIEKRKKDRKIGKLSAKTNPAKSNVTRTNQLLESFVSQGDSPNWIIEKSFNRKKSITIDIGKEDRDDTNKTNSEIVFHLEAQGRIFMNASKQENKRLQRRIKDEIINELIRSRMFKK